MFQFIVLVITFVSFASPDRTVSKNKNNRLTLRYLDIF